MIHSILCVFFFILVVNYWCWRPLLVTNHSKKKTEQKTFLQDSFFLSFPNYVNSCSLFFAFSVAPIAKKKNKQIHDSLHDFPNKIFLDSDCFWQFTKSIWNIEMCFQGFFIYCISFQKMSVVPNNKCYRWKLKVITSSMYFLTLMKFGIELSKKYI